MNQNNDPVKWRTLLIEDDSQFAESVCEMLSPFLSVSCHVQVEKVFSAAMQTLCSNEFDVILLGCSLADASCIESLRKIKEIDAYAPVIVLSGNEKNEWLPQAIDIGIKGYLPKSCLDSTLLLPMLFVVVENGRKEKKNRFVENRYKNIIENLEDAYYENDLKGVYTYVNKASSNHFGRPRSELIGASYKDNSPEHLQPKLLEEFSKIYQSGKSGKIIDNELVRPDGSIFYTELNVSLIRDENDKIVGFSGISRNVTEKKKVQEALIKSEEKYRNILDNIEDGYFEVDLGGNMIFFNDSMCRMLGYENDELASMNYKDYMGEENKEKVFEAFNKIYRTGHSNLFLQYEIIRKNGDRAYLESTVSLIKDRENKPIGFRGVSRDLTEKKKARQALKNSEERYRNILTSIEDGYFECDIEGYLTFFNQSLPAIFGYTREDLMGKRHSDYMDKKNAEKVFRAYNNIFRTGKPNRSLQYELLSKNKTLRYLESSVSLMKDQKGKVIGFRGIARDITERKLFIIELENAKKGAEAASLAKSEFLANMSHEIRTPMNGVLGMYNLLLSTQLTSEQADFVKTGKRSADALLSVINDILDFSKIEAGKLDIEVIDFDLRKFVEEIVALPAVQAHTKGLEFAYQIDHEVPTLLRGDPGRLRQIIMNLSTNAIKFTHKGEVVFRVAVTEETDDSVILLFSIKDTGIGISKKDQARLFNSFQQVDASTTRKYGGTGLGLAISKKLVELMGGTIYVDSIRGKGSMFWFTTTFEKQEEHQEKTYEMLETIQGKRILIVDDNQTNLDILSGYLTYWGCSCDQAMSGQMGLSLMRAVAKASAPYDLVISDMLMPEMDGAELGRIIKADPELKSSQLIMLTSQGLRGDAAEMKRIGFSAYLNKPVRRSLLYDCLITVVNRTQGGLGSKQPTELVTTYTVSEEKRHNLSILLAEDNPVNQKVALHLLKKFGFKADSVNNGKEAIHALESKEYQVVLMDIQMPEMDGVEATKMIRNPNSSVMNHDVLIIAMTAHAMMGDREMCLKAGMDDYISKPIKPDLLLKVIEKNIKDFD